MQIDLSESSFCSLVHTGHLVIAAVPVLLGEDFHWWGHSRHKDYFKHVKSEMKSLKLNLF